MKTEKFTMSFAGTNPPLYFMPIKSNGKLGYRGEGLTIEVTDIPDDVDTRKLAKKLDLLNHFYMDYVGVFSYPYAEIETLKEGAFMFPTANQVIQAFMGIKKCNKTEAIRFIAERLDMTERGVWKIFKNSDEPLCRKDLTAMVGLLAELNSVGFYSKG